jgi:hypothetical protein
MSKSKFTPGPWYTIHPESGEVAHEKTGNTIARCVWAINDMDYSANARLIAEAPSMYDALRALFANCTMVHTVWGDGCNQKEADEAIASARAILARIEGE